MKKKFDTFEIVMALVAVGALSFVFLSGGKSAPGVVLLDVQRTFRDLGRDIVQIQEERKQQDALDKKLANLRTELENKLTAKTMEPIVIARATPPAT